MTPLKRESLKLNSWFGLLDPKVTTQRTKQEPVEVWQCPVCGDTHDSYDEAAECCADESEEVSIVCPVCCTEHGEFQQAVDCCLWSEFDWPQRYKIAGEMGGGATWPDAIEKVTGEKL